VQLQQGVMERKSRARSACSGYCHAAIVLQHQFFLVIRGIIIKELQLMKNSHDCAGNAVYGTFDGWVWVSG